MQCKIEQMSGCDLAGAIMNDHRILEAHRIAQTIPYCFTRKEKRRRVSAMLTLWREVLKGKS